MNPSSNHHSPNHDSVVPRDAPISLDSSEAQAFLRDPHTMPFFDSQTLCRPKNHVLFLPPLLSALPEGLGFHLVSSETPAVVTETRLPDIDPASLSLHKALHHFRPANSDYASIPYHEAFNWAELLLPDEDEREWYCVVFRSKRKEGIDSGLLYEADRLAHEEAIRNGGLILYWYGIPDETTGMNLATCIWQSRRHAVAANSRPHHIKAMKFAAESYQVYSLERFVLRKDKGRSGITIDSYTGGDVGW